jgi:hypothetical protein
MWRALVTSVLLLIATAATRGVGTSTDKVGPAVTLYRQLRDLGLDPARVYRIRDVGLDRGEIHISLNSGTIAFSQNVEGRVTGAFFDGDGEILLVPPNRVERGSMALLTGTPILEERFLTAFFRFNDNTFERLAPSLLPAEDTAEFLARWDPTFRQLCASDAFELLRFLTWQTSSGDSPGTFWRARLAGLHLGPFDVLFDNENAEQVLAGQSNYINGKPVFDVWASFASRGAGTASRTGEPGSITELGRTSFRITASKIHTHILPSRELEAEAQLTLQATRSGARTLVFELSRYLKVSSVLAGDTPLEFIQNESLEGGDLGRRGNDLVAVVLPRPLRAGEKLELRFSYSGLVLSEAGGGLMYVGERGIWYPNTGPAMSDFDLEFRYPGGWTLVATGKQVSSETVGGEQVSRWVSERPIPLAGFNLGKYVRSRTQAGETTVEIFAARGVEKSFPQPEARLIDPRPFPARPGENVIALPPLPPPSPALQMQAVAQRSTRAVEFLSRQLGSRAHCCPGRLQRHTPLPVLLRSHISARGPRAKS